MASLESQDPKDTYQGLLKTTDDASVGASKKAITDGGQGGTGLSLSKTKVYANTLQIENAPSSSTNVNVATLGTSGDVESRVANAKVFDTAISDVFFAKCDGDEVSPLVYLSVADTTASSLVVGDDTELSGSDVVIVEGSIGDVIEVSLHASVQFEQADAYSTWTLRQNENAINSGNFGNTSGVVTSDEFINLTAVTILTSTADSFDVTYADTSGTTNISTGTYLKLQKFS